MALRIIYEGDEAAAKAHLPRAQNLMHKVREFVAASGAGVFSQTLVLDDASYAYCLKVGDLETIQIVSLPDNPFAPPTVVPFPILPDLYSGVVRGGMIRTDTIQTANGEATIKKLEFFKPNAVTIERNKDGADALAARWQAVKKLAVEPHGIYFAEYQGGTGQMSSDPTVPRTNSQYLEIRPSNYTGKMQKLAQIVLGYGHVQPMAVHEEQPQLRTDIVKNGLQITYDFRWHRTHGVVTAADGKLWLVEISNLNGVLAMPLPIFKDSAQRLADTKWTDYQTIVQEFGGLPSGYGFPLPRKLKAEIEAGRILRLATVEDLREFHNLQNYSSVCGWAFNEAGTEAHNTGWSWGDDGMKRSHHYMLNIEIGETRAERKEGMPIAVATAKLKLASTGRLFHGSEKYPPPFKFYEPLIGGLLSANMLPTLNDASGPNVYGLSIICDCPMFVYFADDQLKVVRYYYDRATKSGSTTENDFETCMYVGAWQQVTTAGGRIIPAMFYTTDYDHREELPASITTTNIVGVEVGTFYYMGDHIEDVRYCDYYRRKWFRKTTTSAYSEGMNLANAVIVPRGLRNGIAYALYRSTTSSWTSKSTSYDSVQDPNWYEGYRALFSTPAPNQCYVKDVRKVLRIHYDNTNRCAIDLADNGPWQELCDTIPEKTAPFTLTGTASSTSPKPEANISFELNTDAFGILRLGPVPGSRWDLFRERSPNDQGDVQYMACMHSAKIGAPQIYYSTTLNPTGSMYAARGTMMEDAVSGSDSRAYSYNFVGVP